MQELEDSIIRAPSPAMLANCRALVVGGEEEPRRRLRRLAEGRAFDTREAMSGGEAIARLHNEHCPIMIVDSRLPDMSPAQLCNEVRDSIRSRYIYTLLLCEPQDSAAIVAGLRAGADDCLSRTARAAELTARLESARRIAALEQGLLEACETNARIATTDRLTGVFNRRYLDKELPRELERARRYGRPLSVLALDLDHFKHVNDRYGHATGDRALQAVTRVLQKRLRREVDWVARAGGEEFVVVLPETAAEGARIVAERLRDAIRLEPIAIDPEGMPDRALGPVSLLREPLHVTASFGLAAADALTDLSGLTAERLLANADAALYRSKRTGRNRVTAHVPLRAVN